jgi:hypothetical protein
MKRRRILLAVGGIWGFFAVVASAWAAWTGSGVGVGAAAVGSANAPTSVTATQPNTALRTVHVTWAIPATPDGSAPSSFTVARSNGSTSTAACGTGTTPLPGTSTNCDDTNVASGTYTYTVTMNWSTWTATSVASSSITVAASALHHFTVVPSTSTPTAGTQFSVTVTAVDQYGSTFAGYTGSQCVTFSGPGASPAPASTAPAYPAGGTGCTGSNSLVAFSSGVGTPNVTLYNAQSTTLTVTDVATSKTGTSSSLTVSPAGISRLVVSPSTSTPTAGTSFTAPLTAHDAYDNVATSYTGAKTITWSALATSPAPASQAPSYPVSAVTFSAGASTTTLTATAYAGGANTLTATDAGGKTGSASITVSAAAINSLAVSPSTSTPTAGTSFTAPLTAHDLYDNVATSYTGAKTITWSALSTSPAPSNQAPSYPVSAVTFSAGASTTTLTATAYAAGANTLTATDAGGKTGSAGVTVSAAAASKLAITTQPSNATGGATISPSPVVAVEDTYSNVATTNTSNVTMAIGTNPSGGTLSGTLTVAASAGVATFNSLSINKTGTGYTLVATDGVLTSATSSTFNITVGAAAKLAFTTQPGGGTGGTAWTTQPVVTIQDAGGNTVTTSTASVTLAIGTNPGGGALTCTANPKVAVSGVATFAGCKIDKAANGYTLTATSGSLTSATSNTFNVTVGTAAKLAFTTQPGGGARNNAWATQPVVSVQDAGGNTVTTSTASVTLAIGTNAGGGSLSCTTNPKAAVSGVATFAGCSISKAGNGYTLNASATGLTAATSNTFNIT